MLVLIQSSCIKPQNITAHSSNKLIHLTQTRPCILKVMIAWVGVRSVSRPTIA